MKDVALGTACVIGIETDVLYPLRQQEAIADTFSALGCEVIFAGLPSHHGHDAFLTDYDRFIPIVSDYFARIAQETP